jgi:ribosomal protein L21E
MKKIMFNDKFGLTQAVLDGRKTMTRRSIPKKLLESIELYAHGNEEELRHRLRANSSYQVGEVVAIAQAYKDIYNDAYHIGLYGRTAGWTNKMYVAAYRMPHHIKITNIRVEHLQDISDDDCLREGIYFDKEGGQSIGYPLAVPFYYTFRGAINREGRQLYWSTPKDAFAALIDKVSGKGTWDSNPMVWVYEFELVD